MVVRIRRPVSRATASPEVRWKTEADELQARIIALRSEGGLNADVDEARVQLVTTLEALSAAEAKTKPKARIGKKRYKMLAALRRDSVRGLTLESLVLVTGFQARRVREQINADMAAGVVVLRDDAYRITGRGIDLMARYEARCEDSGTLLPELGTMQGNTTPEAASAPKIKEES